jgi:hypothetical protein
VLKNTSRAGRESRRAGRRRGRRASHYQDARHRAGRAVAVWNVRQLSRVRGAVNPLIIELTAEAIRLRKCEGADASEPGSQSTARTSRKPHFNILLCSKRANHPCFPHDIKRRQLRIVVVGRSGVVEAKGFAAPSWLAAAALGLFPADNVELLALARRLGVRQTGNDCLDMPRSA